MQSLEKKMFFLPHKLFINKDKLYVSFNVKVIPRDMVVTSMFLLIPLPRLKKRTKVYVNTVTSSWKETSIKKGHFPTRSENLQLLKCVPKQKELLIDITNLEKKWRSKGKHNYGIYIRLKNKSIEHLDTNPPYLIVDTI